MPALLRGQAPAERVLAGQQYRLILCRQVVDLGQGLLAGSLELMLGRALER
jgi:hypothetical protein